MINKISTILFYIMSYAEYIQYTLVICLMYYARYKMYHIYDAYRV